MCWYEMKFYQLSYIIRMLFQDANGIIQKILSRNICYSLVELYLEFFFHLL